MCKLSECCLHDRNVRLWQTYAVGKRRVERRLDFFKVLKDVAEFRILLSNRSSKYDDRFICLTEEEKEDKN